MRIHWLQHVPFEGLGSIDRWIKKGGHTISLTRLFANESLPDVTELDWLIVMGGSMSAHDEDQYPWLIEEKQFIKDTINAQKIVLGICLGAQLIAEALGVDVYKNTYKEIGWYPIQKISETDKTGVFEHIPSESYVFHWHGETFDLPVDADLLATSDGCKNQAFVYENRVLGLQFHLEITGDGIQKLIENCGDEIIPAPYIQSREEMLTGNALCDRNQKIMDGILDKLSEG